MATQHQVNVAATDLGDPDAHGHPRVLGRHPKFNGCIEAVAWLAHPFRGRHGLSVQLQGFVCAQSQQPRQCVSDGGGLDLQAGAGLKALGGSRHGGGQLHVKADWSWAPASNMAMGALLLNTTRWLARSKWAARSLRQLSESVWGQGLFR